MLSVYWPSQSGARNTTGESTFVVDRQLAKRWDAFVEYVGDYPDHGASLLILNSGGAYRLTKTEQIDFHVAFGLNEAAPTYIVGLGYSFRVDDLF